MKKEKKSIFDRFSIRVGDTISIYQKDQPPFLGIVIARHGGSSPSATFTIRAVLSGIGVEKIYPLHSPLITKIEKIKEGRARRAKLYYLREKVGQEAKIKEIKGEEKTRAKTKTDQKATDSKNK